MVALLAPQHGLARPDAAHRSGLALRPPSRRLLMGSTTGRLWPSDDGGDSWTAVSNLLPPIHAVRFG